VKRRNFLKTTGAAAMVLAMPNAFLAALSGLNDDEIEQRVKELLGKMTLDEKIAQMHGVVPGGKVGELRDVVKPGTWNTPENKRLGIPGFKCIDGPRGVGMGLATCFPVTMARGATWDPDLERRVGEVMGYETRALGANVLLGTCINLLRHPSWGRAQETYGEDPVLLGRMGVGSVLGVQKHVMADAKHFAANSIEDTRFFVNVKMDERTLREMYLPHFKKCVDAGAATVMSAYNDLNGQLCGQNRHLITDILKNEWGFRGFVVSDWNMAVDDAVAAANAGLDLEMPTGAHFGDKLKQAVREGKVSEQTIDAAVTRLLRQKLRFITPDFEKGYDRSRVGGKEHAAVALEAARKGIVLLKNEKALLPLDRKSIKTIAVVGKKAGKAVLGDIGSSDVKPPHAVSPLAGIKDRAGAGIKVLFEEGPAGATKAAKEADVVIVVAGFDFHDEGEAFNKKLHIMGDRENLSLHAEDEKLIKEVAAANGRCIVVLEGGAAVTVGAWKDRVPAILMAWYPGMEGGNAIADIIFGDVNPSGKLPIVFPKSLADLPKFDNRSKEVEYDLWHGYRYQDRKGLQPEFPFGFGLSYTQYRYGNLKLSRKQIGKSGKLAVQVDVTNAGQVAGEEIVQLYVGYPGSKVERAAKELKGFGKLALSPGETKTLTLEVKAEDLAYYNMNNKGWEIEEIEYRVMVGPSSRPEDLALVDSFGVAGA
jgi:beta-glucosidase